MSASVTIEIIGANDKSRALYIARSILNDLADPHESYFDFQSFTAKRYEAEVKVTFTEPK